MRPYYLLHECSLLFRIFVKTIARQIRKVQVWEVTSLWRHRKRYTSSLCIDTSDQRRSTSPSYQSSITSEAQRLRSTSIAILDPPNEPCGRDHEESQDAPHEHGYLCHGVGWLDSVDDERFEVRRELVHVLGIIEGPVVNLCYFGAGVLDGA